MRRVSRTRTFEGFLLSLSLRSSRGLVNGYGASEVTVLKNDVEIHWTRFSALLVRRISLISTSAPNLYFPEAASDR